VAATPVNTVIRQLRRVVRLQNGARQTDAELLTSFIDQRDEAAFEAFVRRHGPMVLGVCRRVVRTHHDAEDAFQAAFLVLARKASTIQPRKMAANWLYGVAYRTAMKARAMSAKRRTREKPLNEVSEPEAAPRDQWSDLQSLLDRELNGLPDNYRVPILLCDVEGTTIKEAARQLGWPQGTMAGRLARGRKLLAKRLANRGLEPSVGLLATIVSREMVAPAVPTSLTGSTVEAVARTIAGKSAVAGLVRYRVAVLMEGVLKGMLLTKLKTGVAILLVVGALAFAAGPMLLHRLQAAQDAAPKPKSDPKGGGGEAAKQHPNRPLPKNDTVRLPPFTSAAPVQAIVSLQDGKLVVLTATGYYMPKTTKRADGQKVTSYVVKEKVVTTEYELTDVKLRDMKGKPIDVKQLPKLLDNEMVALIAKDGVEVDPLHLRLIKDGTLLFLLPPDPVPGIAIPVDGIPAVPAPVPAVPVPAFPADPS
jgi:RNA polymerase sigma factor (sigma-70 family)